MNELNIFDLRVPVLAMTLSCSAEERCWPLGLLTALSVKQQIHKCMYVFFQIFLLKAGIMCTYD